MGQGIAGLSGCDWCQCMNLTKFRDTMVKGGWVSQMFKGELLKKLEGSMCDLLGTIRALSG